MSKFKYGIAALLWTALSFLPLAASAHTLLISGPIGITFHLDPDDDPIVGQDASLQFIFEDTSNQFSVTKCDCVLIVRQGKQAIARKTFSRDALRYGSQALITTFAFPQRDIYTLELIGKPTTANAFHAFDLTWTQRVARTSAPGTSEASGPIITMMVGMTVLGLGALVAYEISVLKRKAT